MPYPFIRSGARNTGVARCLAAAICLLSVAAPASAQLFRVSPSSGASRTLELQGYAGVIRGTDVGYDPVNNVFLIVTAYGKVNAQFVDALGAPISSAFTIMDGAAYFSTLPRATYSPDANGGRGGFLVTWHGSTGAGNATEVHGLMVAYPAGVISPDTTISSALEGSTYWEFPTPAAYSATSRRFLVVWTTTSYAVQGRFVDPNGAPIGSIMPIENPGGSRWAATAWNAVSDQFGISYCGFGSSGAYARFRQLRASDGSVSPRTTFGFTTGTFASDIAFSNATGNLVMTWSTGVDVQSAAFDAGGNMIGSGLVSIYLNHSADNLGLSFNPATRTFLVVGHSGGADDIGVELNSNGAPNSSYAVLTGINPPASGGYGGSYYPRAAANTTVGQWAVSFSANLSAAAIQIVGTTSTNGGSSDPIGSPWGGGTGSGGSTPPIPCTTPDPFVAMGGGTCVNGGWLPPSSNTGSTASCTTPQPGTGWTCVNGGWLPPGSGTGATGGSTGGCTSVQPGTGWTCVNGGWLPPGSITGSTGGSTGSCTTIQPGAGWTCVNGGWLPPSSSTGSTGGCTTPDPFASMGGGTCVNGGWLPPGSGTGSTGGCTTPDPFASLGGGTCVSGGWIPRGTSGVRP